MSSRFPSLAKGKTADSKPTAAADDLDARACACYMAKLKSVLDSATGDPPPGIDVGEVEHRIMLLQGALEEVKIKNLELTKERELTEQQRYMKALHHLMSQEEELQMKQAKDNKAKLQAVMQAKEEAAFYFRDKNEKKEERTQKCREHSAKAQEEAMLRASAAEVRRQKNLENLYAEREHQRKEVMERAMKREQYARSVLKNREKSAEERRKEMEERVRLQDQEIEAKLEMIRNSRKSTTKEKTQHSRAKSIVVWENGEAVLETELKDHAQLVKELREKEKMQDERVAAERADQNYYIQTQQQSRKDKEMKIAGNLLKLANKRLARGEEIIVETAKKSEKSEKAHEKRIEKQQHHSKVLQKDLLEHQRRSEQIEKERQNAALASNFQRWNFRAARIITELRSAMDDKKKEEPEDDDPWKNNSRSKQPEPEKRPVRLPSPSDFKC